MQSILFLGVAVIEAAMGRQWPPFVVRSVGQLGKIAALAKAGPDQHFIQLFHIGRDK